MNSSEGQDFSGLGKSIDRLREETEEEKKRTEEEKKRLDEREIFLNLLKELHKENQGIKKNMVSQTEMVDFFNKFNDFLNEFSHLEGYLKDSEHKGKLSKAADDLRKFCIGFVKK